MTQNTLTAEISRKINRLTAALDRTAPAGDCPPSDFVQGYREGLTAALGELQDLLDLAGRETA